MLKNNIIFCLIFLLLPLTMWGQEDICIGKQFFIQSTVLNEERTYWVHVPDAYNRDKEHRFPVIYLLDGDSFFHSLVGMNKMFSRGKRKDMASFIIVGILNTDRTRDLTPTASAAGRDGKVLPDAIVQGGGGDLFARFLTEELRSVIDNSFRTNGKNMLVGHSFGGLFVLNTFLKYTDLFDTYLAVDPSLWWDEGRLAREAAGLIHGKDFTGKNLYIGLATKPRPDRININQREANTLFSEVLPQAQGLRFFYQSFPRETHGTVAVPGIYDGIRQLFW